MGEGPSSRESAPTTLYSLPFRALLAENQVNLGEPPLMAAADIGRGRSCQTNYVRLAHIIMKKKKEVMIIPVMTR
jgi:hypothetical protein